jgi:putative ABC transport system substrate-binding protein
VNAAARVLGVQLQVLEARGPDQFEPAFAAMVRGQADALLTFEDSMFWLHRRRLAELESKHRLPTMHEVREFNVKTAEALGLTIPASLLGRADDVIQ